MSATFDLAKSDPRPRSEEGVDMLLLDPAGHATGVTLRVRGTDSRAYQDKLQQQTQRRMERGPRKATEAEGRAEHYELQATLLAGWTGLSLAGEPFAYSPKNAARLLEDYAYIHEQVVRFSLDRRNFLPGSESS
jgi:hypothetical protein